MILFYYLSYKITFEFSLDFIEKIERLCYNLCKEVLVS